MYNYTISNNIHRFLSKISKKDKTMYNKILKKINEIVNSKDISHYKNLKYDMKDSKRVHIGHFVLIFQYNKNSNTIDFDIIEHHDMAYKKK